MSRRLKRQRRAGCVAWLVLLLLLCGAAAAALGGLVLLAVQRPAGVDLVVQLRSPTTGGQAELNHPLGIEATAESRAGVTRLELYADGALAAVQVSSLPSGSNPLLFLQAWTPLTPGRHALVARAYDNSGLYADSNVVYVDVVALIQATYQINMDAIALAPGEPLPSLSEAATSLGVDAQQLLDLNPSLAGGDPSAPLPAGETLNVPRTPAPPPEATPVPEPLVPLLPAPTGLVGTLDCATAALEWTALEGGAGGTSATEYAVYRLGPGDSAPREVATVDAAAYSDPLPGLGEFRYQVAALGPGGESLGPMVTVSTPGTCAPPATPPGTVDIDLRAIALETDAAFDGVYCYLSVDGSAFERVPRGDFSFLTPDAGGLHYDLAAQLPNGGRFVLAAHADSAPVRLTGDCWGRSGAESVPLGTFESSDQPPEWDGAELVAWSRPGGGSAAYGQAGPARDSALARANARVQMTYTLSAAGGSLAAVTDQWLVQAYGLPAPQNLRFEDSIEACVELAQADSRRRRTLLSGGFGPGPGIPLGGKPGEDGPAFRLAELPEALRQALSEQTMCMISAARGGAPTLLWDWSDETGHFSEASLSGYHVVVNLTNLNPPRPGGFSPQPIRVETVIEGLYWQRDIRPGTRQATLARLTDLPCSVRLDYTVTAVYGSLESVPSEVLSFETEPCNNSARVTVEIETLIVGPVNDTNDRCPYFCSTNTLEVVGHLFAGTGERDSIRQWIGDRGEVRYDIRREGSVTIHNTVVVRPVGFVSLVPSGRYLWAEQWLGDTERGVLGPIWRNHQTWTFWATPDETIPIGARLADWDVVGPLQPFCNVDYEIPARRATVWFATDETFTLRDMRGEAACEISVHVVGARTP